METLTVLSEFLKNHADTLGILITLIGLLWTAARYIDIKKKENEKERFRTYHELIRDLVQPPQGGTIFLDRQVAIIYELRHFPEYFPVSRRILRGLRSTWAPVATPNRLTVEIDFTLAYINRRAKSEGPSDV
jgi:hypothetical protein